MANQRKMEAQTWLNWHLLEEGENGAITTIVLEHGGAHDRNGRIALAAMLRDGTLTRNMLDQLADLIDVDRTYPAMRLVMDRRSRKGGGPIRDGARSGDILQTIHEHIERGDGMAAGVKTVMDRYGIGERRVYQIWKEYEQLRRAMWPHRNDEENF